MVMHHGKLKGNGTPLAMSQLRATWGMVAPPCDITPMNCIISSSPRACEAGEAIVRGTSVAVEGAATHSVCASRRIALHRLQQQLVSGVQLQHDVKPQCDA